MDVIIRRVIRSMKLLLFFSVLWVTNVSFLFALGTEEKAIKQTFAKKPHIRSNLDYTALSPPRTHPSYVQKSIPGKVFVPDYQGTIPWFDALPENNWDYIHHGDDWTAGKCSTGKRQSPVDLHIDNLEEPTVRHLDGLYSNEANMWNGDVFENFKPWKLYDFFFSYETAFHEVQIYKTSNVFQIQAPPGPIPLGVLFPTDVAESYIAHQIFFHAPSEHTFQGPSNRREIEMQIWHYNEDDQRNKHPQNQTYFGMYLKDIIANHNMGKDERPEGKDERPEGKDELPAGNDERSEGNDERSEGKDGLAESKDGLAEGKDRPAEGKDGLAEGKDGRSEGEEKRPKDKVKWRVVSITFMSQELESISLEQLRQWPSERFLRSLLTAESIHPNSKPGQPDTIKLETPMNLPGLTLMLQLSNLEFFSYDGSTTFPGCQETVKWYVARAPLPVETLTMQRFYKMLNPLSPAAPDAEGSNFRSLQNLDSVRNVGNVSLVQGFPIQLLIANAIAGGAAGGAKPLATPLCSFYSIILLVTFLFSAAFVPTTNQ